MRKEYERYHIEVKQVSNIRAHPYRFKVRVKRFKLFALLIKEFFKYRGNREVILSRPCVYGVFSGPVGGFLPRDHLCVGCLRCMVEYPKMVKISHNPKRAHLNPDVVDTLLYEAETGRIPIKGAGFRGIFGGSGLDGIWFDFSEIVRPTRDGIHGREYISTEVLLGADYFPIPLLFDAPQMINALSCCIYSQAAFDLNSLAILPLLALKKYALSGAHIIPQLSSMADLSFEPKIVEITALDKSLLKGIQSQFPKTKIMLRCDSDKETIKKAFDLGVTFFHLTGEYGQEFNDLDNRDDLVFIANKGILLAEHMAKNILLGLDALALNEPLSIALQYLPKGATLPWGVQRLKNLVNAWRDQLLEVLGAMGIKEVRRARGELGRLLFQKTLEKEAFEGISGYESIL